jgi:hypothetical protein
VELLINFEYSREQKLQFYSSNTLPLDPIWYLDDRNFLPCHAQSAGVMLPILLALVGPFFGDEFVVAELFVGFEDELLA